jgi:hypothetical protein
MPESNGSLWAGGFEGAAQPHPYHRPPFGGPIHLTANR